MVMDFYEQIEKNKRMTYLLFAVFFVLIGVLAALFSYILGGFSVVGGFFLTIFGVLTILFAVISYYKCDSIVTAVSGAKEAPEQQFRQLHNVVEEMSIACGIPKPRVFVIDDTAINAFATGRDPNHAVVCVTTGALSRLNRDELEGVVAHELSHVRNYDVRTMTIATVLVGIAVLLSDFLLRFVWYSRSSREEKKGQLFIVALVIGLVLAILTPIIAQIIQLAISRKREFAADAGSAQLTRNPLGLASALEKISKDAEPLEAANKATAHLYISDPLKGQKLWMASLFSTHPPLSERIKILKGM